SRTFVFGPNSECRPGTAAACIPVTTSSLKILQPDQRQNDHGQNCGEVNSRIDITKRKPRSKNPRSKRVHPKVSYPAIIIQHLHTYQGNSSSYSRPCHRQCNFGEHSHPITSQEKSSFLHGTRLSCKRCPADDINIRE